MTDLTRNATRTGPTGFAKLTNMTLAVETLMTCHEADEGLPRIGLLHGFSGYGKTYAATYAAVQTTAIIVEAKSVWTRPRPVLEAIARELGIYRYMPSVAALLQQVVDALDRDPRPLIIDEMDHLVKSNIVEIIRDIHDATRVGILLIGEEDLPRKLKRWERFDNRILAITPAAPASIRDAMLLRDHYCRAVEISDDLVELVAERCGGVTRRISVNLAEIQTAALGEGRVSVDRAWWGSRPLKTGDAPLRRKAA